jgi:phage terminase small subunit
VGDKLTTKQRLFVEAYLANPNATEAARRAGYAGNDVTLGAVGAENLKKPQIAALIAERVETVAMGADEVLEELANIARGPYVDYKGDKIKALELIGKHFKLFTDKSEITGKDGEPIKTESTQIIIQGAKGSDGPE